MITIAKNAGFCFGVRRATETVEKLIKEKNKSSVYVLGQLIHNEEYIKYLEENGVFEFETGYGFLFNDFEIGDYFDEEYANVGLTREDITAEFLASAEKINEIHMNFIDKLCREVDIGYNDSKRQYKINVMEIIFTDLATDNKYKVKQEVLDEYNKGVM